MRAESGHIYDLWTAGGPFIGSEGKPHGRVTVEIGWTLGEYGSPVGSFRKPPLRYVQTTAQDQVETEVPNINSIAIERSVDQMAGTVAITMTNQQHNAVGVANTNLEEFGNPGYFTFSRGDSATALALWGHTPNSWNDVLVPNALIRTYQGYGGNDKSIADAVDDGNILLTGVWLIDDVKPATGGLLELIGRDLAALLIDQPLYPPLVPVVDADGRDVYPLRYARYFQLPGTQTSTIYYGVGGARGDTGRHIRGIEFTAGATADPSLNGYWMVGDDGGVFSYGYIGFHGSLAGATLSQPIVGIAATESSNGYWLVGADGGVFAFGDAGYYGSLPDLEVSVTDIVAIERSRGGNGYLLAGADGGVFAFGDAVYDGNGVGTVVGNVVGFDVRHTGTSGYWLCTDQGYVYAFGGAAYEGGLDGATGNVSGFASSASEDGYYLVQEDGAVYTFGDAFYFGGANDLPLNDPITDIAVHPSGDGYWLAAEDGGVFTYGPGLDFYGSLPGPWVNLASVDGNYFDLTDVVKDICLWSGLWINDGGTDPTPHGSFESTGIVSNDDDGALPEALFDKKPGIDAINEIKTIVGYNFRIDEEGGANFASPNWWQPGNWLPDGSHTDTIPVLDESVHVTNYGVLYAGKPMRSRIVIASYQPESGVPGTVTTDYAPANVSSLRGLHKPFMWVNQVFISPPEQQVMAELVDLQIQMQRRRGSVSAAANPLLQVEDQVRILERVTSETYVHYIRSISTSQDLVSGTYDMTIQTNWLGDDEDWAIYTPSVIAAPDSLETTSEIDVPVISGA